MRVSSLLLAVGLAAGVACSAKVPSAPSGGSATVTSLQITVDRSTLDVGTMTSLGATGVAADGTTYSFTSGLTWTTSNNAVLDVRSDGAVMPVSAGEATITLKWRDLVSTKTFAVEQSRSGVFVWGKVTQYQTGLPVGGQAVSADGGMTATTDTYGNYGFWVPGTGSIGLWFSSTRFAGHYVAAPGLRADLYFDTLSCAARYGRVIDADTLKPVPGASVAFTSDSHDGVFADEDGVWRRDFVCPAPEGGGTVQLYVRKPGYSEFITFVGRGIPGVRRLDLAITRQ
jgi:hypothetical protein